MLKVIELRRSFQTTWSVKSCILAIPWSSKWGSWHAYETVRWKCWCFEQLSNMSLKLAESRTSAKDFMQWKRGGEDKVMSNAAKVINFWRNSSFFSCWCYISVYHFISFFWNLEIKFHTKIAPTACFQSWLRLHMLMLISASLSGTLIRYCWKIKFWRSRQICQSDFIT